MTTLDPRALEEAARVKCRQDEEQMLLPDWGDLDGEQQDALRGEASDIITAYLVAANPIVETVQALKDLPVGVVVRSAAGTIACRADESAGVVFGDERSFPWTSLMLPARVIWRHTMTDVTDRLVAIDMVGNADE